MSAYDTLVLADAPNAYWRLDDVAGTSAADPAGSYTRTNSGTFTLGQSSFFGVPGAVLLDGSTAKVAVPTSASLQITGNLSVEAWVKRTSGTGLAEIVCKPFTSNSNPFFNYNLDMGRSGNIFSFFVAVGTTFFQVNSTTAAALGIWYHVVGTYDGAHIQVYVNGELNCTPVAATGTLRNDAQPLTLGGWSIDGQFRLPGTLASVAVYPSALSATQIRAHWLAGANVVAMASTRPVPPKPRLQSRWARGLARAQVFPVFGTKAFKDAASFATYSAAGTVAWGRGPYGPCLAPNDATRQGGVNLGISVAQGATEFTLSALASLDTTVGGGSGLRLLWGAETATANMRVELTGGLLQFQVGTDGAFPNLTALPPPLNLPVLITCRLAPGGIRSIWYGPYKVAERTDAAVAWGSTGVDNLTLGSAASLTTRNWSGQIHNGYVFTRALTDAEIVALAADPFAPARVLSARAWLSSAVPGLLLSVAAADGLSLAGTAAAARAIPVPAPDALHLGDAAASARGLARPASAALHLADLAGSVRDLARAATSGLVLQDAGGQSPSYFTPATSGLVLAGLAGAHLDVSAADDALHLGDAAAGVLDLRPPGSDALHLGDVAGAVRDFLVAAGSGLVLADLIVSPATYEPAASSSLHLADGESTIVITTYHRAAADGLHLADAAAEHVPIARAVIASTTLELRDHAGAHDTIIRLAVADALVLADAAVAHDGTPRSAAATQLHLADRARPAILRGLGVAGDHTLHLADRADARRDILVSARDGLGLAGPEQDRRDAHPVATTTLVLDAAARTNHLLRAAAASSLVLAGSGAVGVRLLGAAERLRLRDRADARLGLGGGGGPPGDPGSGLRDVLLAGLCEDFPVSFAETPNGLILIANGVDPMIRWDGLSARADVAGVAPPATAIALGGYGVGTLTGTYTAYQRFLDAAGTPSNLSPVSNPIVGGGDGPIEAIDYDPATGVVTVRSPGHGLPDGVPVVVSGVEGLPTVNGTWTVGPVDGDRFILTGLAITGGRYTAGGTWTFGFGAVAYSAVARPASPRVARRQILRNLDGDATVYYVDIDTADLDSDTFVSTKTDEELAAGDPVPILYRDETPHANRFGFPPSHKACLAAHLGRIFVAGEVTYDRGSVVTSFGSPTVRGVGTDWRATFAGRLLYVVGAGRSHEVAAVDELSQVLTLTEPYTEPTAAIAGYAIRPAPGERRLVYYSEPSLPESWPAWNAVAFPEDGDEITGLLIRGSFLYVLGRRHIYRFTFQADPNLDGFSFLATTRGCVNHRCQVQAEDAVYLLDEVGIYRFDGQAAEPISTPIQQVFQQGDAADPAGLRLNWDADRRLWHAAHDPVRETIRWFVALSGWREPRHALCYDYRRLRWWVEEYPLPVTASSLGTVGHRRSLGGSVGRRVLCLAEGPADGLGPGQAARGPVTAAGPLSLISAGAGFPADLAGTPLQVVAGKGAGQARTVVAGGGDTLRIDRPWRVRPDATSTYQLGGVPWRWRSGWHSVAPDESENPRDLGLVYQPTATPATVDARLYYDHAPVARDWALDRDQDGVSVRAGEPDVRFATDTARGYSTHRLSGHQDPYSYGDNYVSVALAGVQAAEPVRVFGVVLKGSQP